MDKEIKFFWRLPRSLVDVLYFANRYIAILGAISYLLNNTFGATLSLCNYSLWFYNIAGGMNIVFIDYILLIRVLALYSQDKRLSILLKSLLFLEACTGLGAIIYTNVFLQHSVVALLAKDISVRAGSNEIPLAWAIIGWAIPLSYATVLISLAIYKAVEHWRLSSDFGGSGLMKVIIEDHIMYFALVIICSVFNVLSPIIANDILCAVMAAFGNTTLLSVLGSRMLLNLKEAGERSEIGGSSHGNPSETISDLDFSASFNSQRITSGTSDGEESWSRQYAL